MLDRYSLKANYPGPPNWGLGTGLTTLSHKKLTVTETRNAEIHITQTRCSADKTNRTLLGESQRETQNPIGPIVAPEKQKMYTGFWNDRTMGETSKTAQVAKEMMEYNIKILGISESRWKGIGSMKLLSGETILDIGDEESQQSGVAIMMSEKAKKSLMEWTPVNKRIIKARFYSKYTKMTVIQAYAPINDSAEEDKD